MKPFKRKARNNNAIFCLQRNSLSFSGNKQLETLMNSNQARQLHLPTAKNLFSEYWSKGSLMSESRKALTDAINLESEAAEGIDAAKAEQELGQPSLSLGLLKEAVEKERSSLDLLEESVDMLRQALDERRQALNQQAEILDQLTTALSDEKTLGE